MSEEDMEAKRLEREAKMKKVFLRDDNMDLFRKWINARSKLHFIIRQKIIRRRTNKKEAEI